ncbi:MAG: ATP-binding cassette domain-containing protein [Planctomycetota bacterium]|nr:ATP-binding cassette domain-containing protein [Planctomycetota bacterium]
MTGKAESIEERGPAVRVRGLTRRHRGGDGVGPLDLELPPAGHLAVVGPSGCGKSTLLRVLAGLEPADAGSIEVDGRRVERLPAGRRSVGLIEQHLPLYDHLTVRGNVEMAISGMKLERPHRDERVAAAVTVAGADSFVDRRAADLSGGERARVCLARLLAHRPTLALLDEPFAGLDRRLRDRVGPDTLAALAAAGVATILVTHDDRDVAVGSQRLELDSSGRPIV